MDPAGLLTISSFSASDEQSQNYTSFRLNADKYSFPEFHANSVAFKTDMLSSDRLVAYECRKAYTAFLNKHKIPPDLVTGILLDETMSRCHSSCLEICVELLSRHCMYCQYYAEQMAPTLYKYGEKFFLTPRTLNTLHTYSEKMNVQCTFCLFKVLCKYVKLIRIFKCEQAVSFIESMIRDFKDQMIDILFEVKVPKYSTRQIILFLSGVLKLNSLTISDPLKITIIRLNNLLVEKLTEVDLGVIIHSCSNGGFSGQETFEDGITEGVDILHIMEWSYLVILTVSTEGEENGMKRQQLLQTLDRMVKQRFGQDKDVLLSWLKDIFGHQDDMWIDVLNILVSFTSKGSIFDERLSLHNDWYFLQFVSAIGYDHSTMLDLLTSPETCFLRYLTAYLRCVIHDWEQFKHNVQIYQIRLRLSNTSIESLYEVGMNYHTEILSAKESDYKYRTMNTYDSKLNESQIQFKDDEAVTADEKQENNKRKLEIVNHEIRNGKDKITCKTKKAQKVSGLDLISNMYQDSDSESEIVPDVETDPVVGKNHDLHQNIESELDNSRSSNENDDSLSFASLKHSNQTQNAFDQDTDQIDGDPDHVDVSTEEIGEDVEVDEDENNVLDSVMSTLIRVRLKLEKVWESGVISYNPQPLITLLQQVESLYET